MTKPQRKPITLEPFAVAHASAEHWGAAAKACLDGLELARRSSPANIGFLYVTEGFAEDLGSILTFLRETTRIDCWVGAAAPGICADEWEFHGEALGVGGGLAVMAGTLPTDSFQPFALPDFRAYLRDNRRTGYAAALLHADPRHPAVVGLAEEAADALPVTFGGLVASHGPEQQVAEGLASGVFSGLLLSPEIEVVMGLSQGCSPIGPIHRVTDTADHLVVTLDGRRALDVLKSEAGDLIARDLRRAAGYIHVGLPVPSLSLPHQTEIEGDYSVRSLMGVDPVTGRLAVAAAIEVGDPVIFVRRDANTARADLIRMAEDVKARLGGRTPLGAVFISCIARGEHMFGEPGTETALIREILEDLPVVGFYANGEIAQGRLYGYTGVLAVLAAR